MPAVDLSSTINGSQHNADLLADILDGDEAPTETEQGGTRYIEVFNKLEEDTRYRFESSDQN